MMEAYLESRVLSADPLELICLLYQHALDQVQEARRQLASGEIAARSKAISKAIGVLGTLTGSLDRKAGGDIAANLERLYGYMTVRLTEANMRQDDRILTEVQSLLITMADGWNQIRPRQTAPAEPPPVAPETAWQDSGEALAGHMWNA